MIATWRSQKSVPIKEIVIFMIRDKKIRMKATAASCLVKFTEKYEAGAHADIFGNATFSHTGRRRGDK